LGEGFKGGVYRGVMRGGEGGVPERKEEV